MKSLYFILCAIACMLLQSCGSKGTSYYTSTKEERNLIKAGNKEFADSNYAAALQKYSEALTAAPGSEPAIFDRAAAMYEFGQRQPDGRRDTITAQAVEVYESLGNHAYDVTLREKANYNLGGIDFRQQDYKKSIEYYKKVLRSNPGNLKARENLRVAQLKLPPEDQNQDQDQNQQNQDQKEQEQQQQDQQQDQQEQQQQPQQMQQQQMSNNAEQILQTMQNRENQTRENAKKEERNAVPRTTDKPW